MFWPVTSFEAEIATRPLLEHSFLHDRRERMFDFGSLRSALLDGEAMWGVSPRAAPGHGLVFEQILFATGRQANVCRDADSARYRAAVVVGSRYSARTLRWPLRHRSSCDIWRLGLDAF